MSTSASSCLSSLSTYVTRAYVLKSTSFFFIEIFKHFLPFQPLILFFFLFLPLGNFSLIWKRHYYKWRASNFDLSLTLMATEQWLFFSVPHLLWHGASVYNGHLRGPVTLTLTAERFAVELSLPVFRTSVAAGIRIKSKDVYANEELSTSLFLVITFIWK